jgi:multidrug resistance efflux pump
MPAGIREAGFVAPSSPRGFPVRSPKCSDNNRVRTGDRLVQLDKEPYQVELNIAQAALDAAQADLLAAEARRVASKVRRAASDSISTTRPRKGAHVGAG